MRHEVRVIDAARWLRVLAASLALAALPALAVSVREVPPAEIGRAVMSGRVSVVLFTSPDPKCGYCTGQSAAFDQFAKPYGDDVEFLRVQWAPWSRIPEMDLAGRLKGVPVVFVYRAGEARAVLQGGVKEAAWLKAQIDHAVAGRYLKLLGHEKAPTDSASAARAKTLWKEADREALQTWLASVLLNQAVDTCATLNARLAGPLEQALSQWKLRKQPVTDAAGQQLIRQTGVAPGDDAVQALVYEVDQRMAGDLRSNDSTDTGCREVIAMLGRH